MMDPPGRSAPDKPVMCGEDSELVATTRNTLLSQPQDHATSLHYATTDAHFNVTHPLTQNYLVL